MYDYKAKVLRWVDGDTVVLQVDLGFHTNTVQTFRLQGVDTPERGQLGFQEAVTHVNQRAPVNTWHEVTTYKPDKYGRWLVDIWIPGSPTVAEPMSLSDDLIFKGLGREYNGGTKEG